MVAGLFDPGAAEAATRPLAGHSIAVYEPDARLSLVWPVPDEDEAERPGYERSIPEWAEQDSNEWKRAEDGWVVILLNGSPIWQARVWYLDWGSGIGGYVPDFEPIDGERELGGDAPLERWDVTTWAVGLARLLNGFGSTNEWDNLDPTPRIVLEYSTVHPIDAALAGG
jgi:hypothetical protein